MMLNINTLDGLVPVKASKIKEYMKVKYFIHEGPYRDWTATEYSTGMRIGGGSTRIQAEEYAKVNIRAGRQGRNLKGLIEEKIKIHGRANG